MSKYQVDVTLARDLIPEFLAALDMAIHELRKQYTNPNISDEFAGSVGVLDGLRKIIADQFKANKEDFERKYGERE